MQQQILRSILILGWILLCLPYHNSLAAQWQLTPKLSGLLAFSDNPNHLESGPKQGVFLTQIDPGLSIRASGRRLNLSLNYNLQTSIRSSNRIDKEFSHQLSANLKSIIIDKILSVTAGTNISNVSISNMENVNADRFSESGSLTQVSTFNINPVITHHYGEYLDTTTRLNLSAIQSQATELLSNTSNYNLTTQINSGRFFGPLTWSVTLSSSAALRTEPGVKNITKRNIDSTLSYALSEKFSLRLGAGLDNAEFSGADQEKPGFLTIGLGWQPNKNFNIAIDPGINKNAISMNWNPSNRTQLALNIQHSSYKQETGFSYALSFDHRARRSQWNLSYNEALTSTQEILEQRLADLNEQQSDDNPDNNQNIIVTSLPAFSNEVFIQKSLSASISYRKGRTRVNFNAAYQQRLFQETDETETNMGLGFSIRRKLGRHVGMTLRWRGETIDIPGQQSTQSLSRLTIGIQHRLGKNYSLGLGIQQIRSSGTQDGTQLEDVNYVENRIGLQFRVDF